MDQGSEIRKIQRAYTELDGLGNESLQSSLRTLGDRGLVELLVKLGGTF